MGGRAKRKRGEDRRRTQESCTGSLLYSVRSRERRLENTVKVTKSVLRKEEGEGITALKGYTEGEEKGEKTQGDSNIP